MKYVLFLLFFISNVVIAKEMQIYGNADPGIIVNGELYWVGDPTEEEKAAWFSYHLEPVIDEEEEKYLRYYWYGSGADIVTTYAGLTVCKFAKEANPIYAGLSAPQIVVANLILSSAYYSYLKSIAKRTSRYQSASVPLRNIAFIRGGYAVWNIGIILRCT